MHAFVFIGDEKTAKKYALDHANKISKTVFEENIQKIAELKVFLQNTSLSYNKPTTYILYNFDKASTETQNAFLKKLEEPQENLHFILTAQNEQSLLPTIISRVSVKRYLEDDKTSNSNFLNLSLKEKFEKIQNVKKREEAIEFVKSIINEARKDTNYLKYLETLETVYKRLQANGNASLQLTYLVSQLDN